MPQVVSTQELKAAAKLIRDAGGTVHLPRPRVVIWGQEFKTLRELSRDPRCEVSYNTLTGRLIAGWELENAVRSIRGLHGAKFVECWGKKFSCLQLLALDPRCKVCYNILAQKIAEGLSPEAAATDSRFIVKTIKQAIKKHHVR